MPLTYLSDEITILCQDTVALMSAFSMLFNALPNNGVYPHCKLDSKLDIHKHAISCIHSINLREFHMCESSENILSSR